MSKDRKISTATYIIVGIIVLAFVGAMAFFRYHIPGEAELLAGIRKVEQEHGVDSPKLAGMLSLAAIKYQMVGHPDKAAEMYRRILDIDLKHNDEVSVIVIQSMQRLAGLHDAAQEHNKATELYVRAHGLELKLASKTALRLDELTRKQKSRPGLSAEEQAEMSGLTIYRPTIVSRLKASLAGLDPDEDRVLIAQFKSRLATLTSAQAR